ncbi:MAG: M2 family metallopeptidase [Planctomycetota bacterium]
MERNILEFIEGHLKTAVPLEKEFNEARWKLASNGRPADEKRFDEKYGERQKVYGDRESYARILTYDDGDLTETPETARQLRLLRLHFAEHQLPQTALDRIKDDQIELERKVGDHRIVVDGKELTPAEAAKILKTSDDREQRQKIWESMHSIGDELGPMLLRVMGIRNRAARDLGFRDYYRMGLELQEIDETQLLLTIEEVLKATEEPYKKLKTTLDREYAKRFRTIQKKLRPWHYVEPIFAGAPGKDAVDLDKFYGRKSVVKLAEKFFAGIGFDLKSVIAKSDLGVREDKSSREFCLHIDRNGRDVRVFSSIGTGHKAMCKALRQLGAASYYRHLAKNLSFIVREPAHPLFIEAVSLIMERNADDPEFLGEVVMAHKATVTKAAPMIEEQRRMSMLLLARWVPVLVLFERALYEKPGQDLNRTWWTLVDRILHIQPPEGREGRHDWAAHLPFSLQPLNSHNQLFGHLVASQLRAAMVRENENSNTSMVGNLEVGQFLTRKLFATGSRFQWAETLVRVTGENLTPKHFFAEYLQD